MPLNTSDKPIDAAAITGTAIAASAPGSTVPDTTRAAAKPAIGK
jgi:hypothetical protein